MRFLSEFWRRFVWNLDKCYIYTNPNRLKINDNAYDGACVLCALKAQ